MLDLIRLRLAEMNMHDAEENSTPDELAQASLYLDFAQMKAAYMSLTEAQQWLRSMLGAELHYKTLQRLCDGHVLPARRFAIHPGSRRVRWQVSQFDLLDYIVSVLLEGQNPGDKLTLDQLVRIRQRLDAEKQKGGA